MLTYTLNLIRHGEIDSRFGGAYIGCKTDVDLSEHGKEQLKNLRNEFNYESVEAVFSSPLKRCVNSAKILCPKKEIIVIDNLRECDFGDFEGKTAAELDGRPDFLAWASGQMPAPPNGESSEQLTKRLCLALNQIVRRMVDEQKRSANVFMHGATIMMLLAACGLPRRHVAEWQCEHGMGYTIRIDPSLYYRTGAVEVISIFPEE